MRRASREDDNRWMLVCDRDLEVSARIGRWQLVAIERQARAVQCRGVLRTTVDDQASVDAALAQVRGAQRATFFPMPTISISSSAIRERARTGEPIRYLVPDAVAGYIREHGLYGGTRTQ